jgi:UrcA family protein
LSKASASNATGARSASSPIIAVTERKSAEIGETSASHQDFCVQNQSFILSHRAGRSHCSGHSLHVRSGTKGRMTMRKTFIVAGIVAGALSLSIAAPATARQSEATVRYSDLDLSRPDDAATLRHRIGRALEAVCGSYASAESWQVPEIDQCRAQAKARADAEFARIMNKAKGGRLAAR